MTGEEIKQIIDKHVPLSTRYTDQKSYKIGRNAAIYQHEPKPAPDNRIPVPFIRRAVKILKGYFASVGYITYKDDGWFEENLKPIYDKNNEELKTAAVFEDACTYGKGFELIWFEDDGFHFATLRTDQVIPLYTKDLEPKLEGFIWHREIDGVKTATYYDDENYLVYQANKKEEYILNTELSGTHLFWAVPVVEYQIDRDNRNAFDHCLPLMDYYDKLISEVGNEHEKFANSVLLLRDILDDVNKDANGLTQADKIAINRIMHGVGDVQTAAAYLERNVNDGFINNTLDRIERLIYEMLCIFNPNDENFGTSSGIAQAYKLLGLEYLVADMESYFTLGLQNRIILLANHKSGIVKEQEKANFVTIDCKRNLPFDIERIAAIVLQLAGGKQVVSTKTLLQLFPSYMIPDAEAEADMVKAEQTLNPILGSFE
jgi:SPP1 family phage portal protein